MKSWLVFTDGSYGAAADGDRVHGGIVYWGENGAEACVHVVTSIPAFVNMNNVGGEVVAAWSALMSIANIVKENNESMMETYQVDLVHDLQGVGMWPTKWKANTPGTAWYKNQIKQIQAECPNLKINFHWRPGHSGIEGNELADKVAMYTMKYAEAHNVPICNLDDVIKL